MSERYLLYCMFNNIVPLSEANMSGYLKFITVLSNEYKRQNGVVVVEDQDDFTEHIKKYVKKSLTK